MSRLAIINREKKRMKLVKKYAFRRAELRAKTNSADTPEEERRNAREQLSKLPRDSSYVRLRNRCALTGRPRGYYRKFGLGRNKLRELAMRGDVPGLIKASW